MLSSANLSKTDGISLTITHYLYVILQLYQALWKCSQERFVLVKYRLEGYISNLYKRLSIMHPGVFTSNV